MKNISKILLSLGVVFLASCASDDDHSAAVIKPVVSNAGATSFSFVEGDGNTMTIDLNISQAIAQPIFLAMVPTDPNGEIKGTDYELIDNVTDFGAFIGPSYFTGMTTEDVHTGGQSGKVVIIPPYSTSYSFEIAASDDLDTEALLENGSIQLITYANRTGLADNDAIVFDLTVENVEKLSLEFAWDNGPVNLFGTDYDVCANTDVDVYIADGAGFDINNPWPNELGVYDAATGACPESMLIREGQYPDGEYVLFTDLWDNAFAGYGATTDFGMTMTYSKGSAYSGALVQDPSQAYNASTFAGDFNGYLAKLTIAGSIFTITDYNGTVVESGLMAN